jgi:hypothetical protein
MSIWSNIVKRFTAPPLPKPTQEYDKGYLDNLVNILRLYFNQLDNLLEQIVTTTGSAVPVSIGGTNTDAFGRLRTSGPYTLFDSQNRYAKNDLFDETTATGGTVTYDANASTVLLNVTTSSGSSVVRQTYRSFSYQPGKGLLALNTFVMDAAKTNVRTRIGYFNTQNGVFLERNGTTVNIVRRTYTSGAAVDTAVSQSSWNGDKLDGTGDSGYTLDLTKAQILWQDFEWLGVGSVRVGFVIDGQYIICHTFLNANNLSSVYMTTAILPVRYEIENVGAAASSSTLKQICSTVISEGGYEKKVALNVARMTAANSSISTTFVPLVSLRLASGRTGAVVIPDGYSVLPTATSSTTFEIVLVKNPTLAGASWVASDSANVEQDLSATSYTGGTIVQQQFVLSSNLANGTAIGIGDYNWDLQLGATISGTSDIYTLAVRTLSGTHNAIGSLSFWDLT